MQKIGVGKLLIGAIIVSFFFFPIGFRYLPPSLNSKQILAVLGLFFFAYDCFRSRSLTVHKETFISFLFAAFFSIWCFFSICINQAADYEYVTYVVSYSVWLAGAFGTCKLLKSLNGKIDIALVTKLVTFTCVIQCVLACVIDNFTGFQHFVDYWFIQDEVPKKVARLYGIGISLDSGGVRLCMALMLISFQLAHNSDVKKSRLSYWTYIIAFIAIAIMGNMIARTTTAGVVMGLLYLLTVKGVQFFEDVTQEKLVRITLYTSIILLFIVFFTYINDLKTSDLYKQIRFAFEAFYNYAETGEFRTASSDILMDRMWVWPRDLNGWIWGYGYFGSLYKHFAQTDIGYCRFIMYCGLVGFSIFSFFFVYCASVVAKNFANAKLFAFFLLTLTFVIWIKVATDIFQLYALLFSVIYLADDQKQTE